MEISIIDYNPALQPHFERINKQWIGEYFSLEPFDIEQLENPEESILKKGGAILFAKLGEDIVGTVALKPSESGVWEMIKMGVSPEARGKQVGLALGLALLEKARSMGIQTVELYSNTRLEAAVGLYRKLGFKEVPISCTSYGRCDIKMEIHL